MTSLSFAEKTRIGGILRRLMLDENREQAEESAHLTSASANQVEEPLGSDACPSDHRFGPHASGDAVADLYHPQRPHVRPRASVHRP